MKLRMKLKMKLEMKFKMKLMWIISMTNYTLVSNLSEKPREIRDLYLDFQKKQWNSFYKW